MIVPRARRPSVDARAPAPASGARKVLIVEDDADTRNALQISVMAAGMFVYVAEDSDEAHAVARDTQPDVVLLDLGLPGIGGLRTIPMIRDAAPSTRVVVVSAFEESAHAAEALEHGAQLYLEKPIDREQLLAAIDAVFE